MSILTRFKDPDRVEVTLRICISLVVTSVLTLGDFPTVVPESQRVVISSVTAAFTMVLPTLLFSVGAVVFPGMITSACVALINATFLLAVAAAGGISAYTALYFFVALLLAGLRFTKQGANAAMMLMLTSLTTMSLASVAEAEGLDFVASLWTEKGVDNPNAVFRNTLIGMCWAAVCISSGRLLPPWRTARSAHSRKFLPKILKDIATFMKLTLEHHIAEDVEDKNEGESGENENADGDDETGNSNTVSEEKPESLDDMIVKCVGESTLLVDGGMAKSTVFEPRLVHLFCRCDAPVDVVSLLIDLTNAVNDMMFSALTLRAFSKAGFQELEAGGLKGIYKDSATALERCAGALASSKKPEAASSQDSDEEDKNTTQRPFDPIRIRARAEKIEALTNEWIDAMHSNSPMTSRHAKPAWKLYAKSTLPWIYGAGVGLILAIFGCFRIAFTPLTWRRIFLPPYFDLPKFAWCLRFALGFTFLVMMNVYWPEFANLEIPTADEIVSPHFAGWYLIAYAFCTTQTVEGTWKKGTLRAFGTCLGGFSAWLALTACGDSVVGLGIWMSAFNTAAAFVGLPEGFGSRFGLDTDMAWGMAYFAMTQNLIVMEVWLGYGGKNDITANRIVANLVGIGMALVMGTIPPSIYGSSPRVSKILLEDKKRVFKECLALVMDSSETENLHHLHAMAENVFVPGYMEAKGNYDDAKQLERLCILKADPALKFGLANMAVLGSSILSLIRFAVILKEIEPEDGKRFAEGSQERRVLEAILEGLDIEEDKYNVSAYKIAQRKERGKHRDRPDIPTCGSSDEGPRVVPAHTTFTHLCMFICNYIRHREIRLDEVKFGFVGMQHTSEGRRSRFPVPAHTLYEDDHKVCSVVTKEKKEG